MSEQEDTPKIKPTPEFNISLRQHQGDISINKKPGEIYPLSYPAGYSNARAMYKLGEKIKLKGGIRLGETPPIRPGSSSIATSETNIYNSYEQSQPMESPQLPGKLPEP